MITNCLPSGWVSSNLEELAGVTGLFSDGDWIESKDQDPAGEIRLIQLADVGDGRFLDRSFRFVNQATAVRLGCTFLEKDDVLVGRMPEPLGRSCVFPGLEQRAITAVDVAIVRPGPGIDRRWLSHFINAPQFRKEVRSLQKGTTRKRISRRNLGGICLPLPPLPEQRRIVEAIESNFARLDEAVAALDQTARAVEGYWHSVQNAAFTGRLTAPPASDSTHGGDVEQGIPRGWSLTTVGALKQFSMYGPRFSSDEYSQDGTAIVRTTDMREDTSIDFTESPRITLTAEDLERYRLERGDLLITRTGSLGTLAVYNGQPDAIAGAFLIQYRLNHPMTTVRYVAYWLRSPVGRAHLLSHAAGSGRPNLSSSGIDSIPVPLAPVEEQSRILETLNKHYSWVLAVRDAIRESRSRAIRVRKGILRSAFSGNLVPQDPSDEPASVLLERISKERSSGSQSMTRKRKTPSAS